MSNLEQYARAAALAEHIEPLASAVYTALELAGVTDTIGAERTTSQIGELARALVAQIEDLVSRER